MTLTATSNTLQLGVDHATAAVTNTLKAPNTTTGTGANLQLQGGTGSVAGGSVVIRAAATTSYASVATFSSSGLAIGASGTAIAISLNTTTTWDVGNLADGASETKAGITLTGAAVGDVLMANLTTAVTAGWKFSVVVTAADTVAVTITNNTGGALDLASGTLRILGFR